MKPLNCTDVDGLLWKYVDRELAAADLAAVSAHLDGCAACRASYVEKSRDARNYRKALEADTFGEDFVARCMGRLRAEGVIPQGDDCPVPPVAGRRVKGLWILAAAALLVLVPVLFFQVFRSPGHRPLGSYVAKGISVVAGTVDARGDFHFQKERSRRGHYTAGTAFRVPEESVLTLTWSGVRGEEEEDGSLPVAFCEIKGPALLFLDRSAGRDSFRLALLAGILDARVKPLGREQSLVIETRQATASVVGTRFTVEAGEGETVLRVARGVVAFCSRTATEETVRVAAGESWVLRGVGGPDRLAAGGSPSAAAPPGTPDSSPPGTGQASGSAPGTAGGAAAAPGGHAPAGAPPVEPTLDQGPVDVPNLDTPVNGRSPRKGAKRAKGAIEEPAGND